MPGEKITFDQGKNIILMESDTIEVRVTIKNPSFYSEMTEKMKPYILKSDIERLINEVVYGAKPYGGNYPRFKDEINKMIQTE